MTSLERWSGACYCAFIGLWLMVCAPAPLSAESFQHVEIPVFLDGVELGTVDAEVTGTNELLSIDSAALLAWLKPILSDQSYANAAKSATASGRLSPSLLALGGLGLEFDAAMLEMRLVIPAQLRRRTPLSLYGRNALDEAREQPVAPASVSAYLNMRAGQEYLAAKGDASNGWQPTAIEFDGAVSLFGATLESVGSYRSGDKSKWTRGDTRIVYDFVGSRTRVAVGDLFYRVDGFETFSRAGGITVGRNFGLQPYRSSAPTGQRNLLVERRSRVDILVNGQRVQTVDLAPGQYNVSDFPFVAGANDVMLRVTDDVGRVDVLTFPFVYDSAVLAKGEQDFQYMVGFASEPTLQGRRYLNDRPMFSGFHIFGVTNQVTVGANVQAARDMAMGGLEARLATRVGTFRTDVSGSRAFSETGYAARLQYRYMDATYRNPRDRSVEVSATYRSSSFTALGLGKVINPIVLDAGVRYGQRLYGPLSGSLGASWQIGRGAVGNASYYDAALSAPLTRGITAYLLFNHTRPAQTRRENRIFLALSWFPAGSGHSVTALHDSRTGSSRLQYHFTPKQYLQGVAADASLERNRAITAGRMDISYSDYRYDLRLLQASEFDHTGEAADRHRTNVALGTALAYADGHFGVSRPISDSFAIVAPHDALRGHRIDVNSYGFRPEARSDVLGPAILPDLASFYRYHAVIDAPTLPDGLDLGSGRFFLLPRYRSGNVLHVGTGANVILEAELVDFAGLPMNLELGVATSAVDREREPINFFSDREGVVHIAGLIPGKVVLKLANYPESEVTIEIPEGTTGRFDAGRITIPVAALPAVGPL